MPSLEKIDAVIRSALGVATRGGVVRETWLGLV